MGRFVGSLDGLGILSMDCAPSLLLTLDNNSQAKSKTTAASNILTILLFWGNFIVYIY